MNARRLPRGARGKKCSTAGAAAVAVLVCSAADAGVYDAEVSWRSVTGAAGYKVYVGYGADSLGTGANVGRPAALNGTVEVVMADLPVGPTSHFSVTAYASDGSESLLSNRLSLPYARVAVVVDSDGDGLTDAQEDIDLDRRRDELETDPEKWDSDGDGTGDGDEMIGGSDPLDIGSAPECGGACVASVWLDASGAAAKFNGNMRSDARYAAGADRDVAADAITTAQVFAESTRNSMYGGSGDNVRYDVYLPTSGRWYAWARLYYPGAPASNDANSFLVRVDGGTRRKLGNNKDRFRRWHWDGRGDVEEGALLPLDLGNLSAGDHQVFVEKREVVPAPPRLDVLVLTRDPKYVPTDRHARAALAAGVMHAAVPDDGAAEIEPFEANAPTTSTSTTSTLPSFCVSDEDCSDEVHCTLDRCDLDTGECSRAAFDAFCDDGDACNGLETCDPLDGCGFGAPLACDDGLVCNGEELCDPSVGCVGGEPVVCDDGVECTLDRCVESEGGCVRYADHSACRDAEACTDERCTAAGCESASNAEACDDGLTCTADDACTNGSCVGRDTCAPGFVCDADAGACTAVPGDPDDDGLRGGADPCPLEPRNLCAGPVALDRHADLPVRVNAHPGDAPCAGVKIDCHGEMWAADFGYDEVGRTAVCEADDESDDGATCRVEGVERIFGCTSEATQDLMRCAHGTARLDGEVRYRFDVPDDRYVVNLFFAPSQAPGDVDVEIEGRRVADELELDDAAEGDVMVRSFVAEVGDGDGITIELAAEGARAVVSALEVLRIVE